MEEGSPGLFPQTVPTSGEIHDDVGTTPACQETAIWSGLSR